MTVVLAVDNTTHLSLIFEFFKRVIPCVWLTALKLGSITTYNLMHSLP